MHGEDGTGKANGALAITSPAASWMTMMKNRVFVNLALVIMLGLGSMLISPLRYALLGFLKQERFYRHRPTSYWLKILQDGDVRYRRWAASALGHVGDRPGVVPALTEALKDKDSEVHCLAATSLGTIGPPAEEAVPALTEAQKNADDEMRQLIDEALSKICPKAVTEADLRAQQ